MKKFLCTLSSVLLISGLMNGMEKSERPQTHKIIDDLLVMPSLSLPTSWPTIFKLIDELGVIPNEYFTVYGDRLLGLAVQSDSFSAVKELLEKYEVNPNQKDINGETALHFAMRSKDNVIIRYLLSHGANPTIKNNFGRSPRDSLSNRHTAIEIDPDIIGFMQRYEE